MKKRLLGILVITAFLAFPCASEAYTAREGIAVSAIGDALAGRDTESTLRETAGETPVAAVAGSAVDRTQLKLAQQQPQSPPYAAPSPPQGAPAGEWVEVPGQWVGGTWVPPHKAWVSANPPPAGGRAGQYAPPPAPGTPPGYGQVGPDVQYAPPPPYAAPTPPDVVPVPGTYVYFVPNIGVDILFYHGYWYRPFEGRWYRGLSYNGPWVYLPSRRVPHVLITLPPGYRRLPPGYHPVPHAELQRNWERWERERHWEHHR